MRRPSSPAMCWATTGALGRRTAMKDPPHQSVKRDTSHTETGSATAARRPAPPRLSARSAAANTARWHTASLPKAEAKYLKSAATTCTEKAVCYKSCAACGLSSRARRMRRPSSPAMCWRPRSGRLDAEQR